MTRTSNSKAWPWVLALLAAVLAVYWVTRTSPGGGSSAPGSEPHVLEPTPATPPSSDEPSELTAAPDPRERSAPPPSEEPRQPWARIVAIGRVTSDDRVLDHALVIARPGTSAHGAYHGNASLAAWGSLDAEHAFRIELSHAFQREMDVLPNVVRFQVVLDGSAPCETHLEVPFTRADFEVGGTLELRANIALPWRCVLTGRAFTSERSELGIVVAAFRLQNGRPQEFPEVVAQVDPRTHAYQLDVDCDSELALIAFTDQFRPSTVVLGTSRRAPPDMIVERGELIRGTVSNSGRPFEATVGAFLTGVPPRFPSPTVNQSRFLWIDGHFEWERVSARSRSDGSYELVGLGPQLYNVHIVNAEQLDDASRKDVRAPADGVELTSSACIVLFDVVRFGQPVAFEQVDGLEIRADGSTRPLHGLSDESGMVQFAVARGSQIRCRDLLVTADAAAGEPPLRFTLLW
ncbi:MAG: hypothetical protein IT454_04565 [Planctomycetes bacterium]|nr:hypothetical protein [Planctomycetota bacterium]